MQGKDSLSLCGFLSQQNTMDPKGHFYLRQPGSPRQGNRFAIQAFFTLAFSLSVGLDQI